MVKRGNIKNFVKCVGGCGKIIDTKRNKTGYCNSCARKNNLWDKKKIVFIILLFLIGSVNALCNAPSSNIYYKNETINLCVYCQMNSLSSPCDSLYSCRFSLQNKSKQYDITNQLMIQNDAGDGFYSYNLTGYNNTADEGYYKVSYLCSSGNLSGVIEDYIYILNTPQISSTSSSVAGGNSFKEVNKTIVCEYVSASLKESTEYNLVDIGNIKLEILKDENMLVDIMLIERCFNNYDYECSSLVKTNKLFISKQCTKDLKSSFVFLDWFLKTNIPIPDIYVGDISCNSINFLKWLFIMEDDSERYKIISVRLFIPLFLSLLIFFFWMYKKFKKIDYLENKIRKIKYG